MVRAAAEGSSGIAVLVGGSSTGKTRACWEALQLLRDQAAVAAVASDRPVPPRCRAARAAGHRAADRGVAERGPVLPRRADGGLGERVAAGLRELLRDPARAPVLVLATLWPQFWDALTARPAGGADPHAQARELLAGHDITVPAAFTAAQLQRLGEAGDARLAQAGRGGAGRAGDPVPGRGAGAAGPVPQRAACRGGADPRGDGCPPPGHGAGLPQAFLEAAAPGYLTDAEWDALGEDWLEQALAYTAVPCKGVRGPLTRIRPRPARSRITGPGSGGGDEQTAGGQASIAGVPLYRLADYLEQHGRAHRKGQLPPAGFWAAAARHAFPGDQAALGDAAHDRGLYRAAAQLHKNAAAHGNPNAVFYLMPTLRTHFRADVRPVHWAAAHAALDDPGAVAWLLGRLREAGARRAGRRAAGPRPRRATPPSTTRAPWPGCWAGCGRRARTSRPPRWPTGPPPTSPSTTRAPWPAAGQPAGGGRGPAGRRAGRPAPPPTSPSTTRAPWPGCWAGCGRRARTSRPPRCWPRPRRPRRPRRPGRRGLRCWAGCGRRARTSGRRAAGRGPPPTSPSTTRAPWPALLDSLREAGARRAGRRAGRPGRRPRPPRRPGRRRLAAGQAAEAGRGRAGRRAGPTPPRRSPSTTRTAVAGCWAACGRRARTSRPPRCCPGRRATPPSTTRAPWPGCWTGCGRRARTSRPPPLARDPAATPPSTTRAPWPGCWGQLREAGADRGHRPAGPRPRRHAPLDNPRAVASLLGCGRRARTAVTALLARDPASHAPLDDPTRRGLAGAGCGRRARTAAAALADRAANAGMFGLFLSGSALTRPLAIRPDASQTEPHRQPGIGTRPAS